MQKFVEHRFVRGLLYDVLGWTPVDKITVKGIHAVRSGLKLLGKEQITIEEFKSLEDSLFSSGMATRANDYRYEKSQD